MSNNRYSNKRKNKRRSLRKTRIKSLETRATEASVWSKALKDRIDKPSCGCRKRFDPLLLCVTSECGSKVKSLLSQCRTAIQHSLGLHRLNRGLLLLPVPRPEARFICELRFQDFFINPLHVQTENVVRGVYPATLEFCKLQVVLQVRRSSGATKFGRFGHHEDDPLRREFADNPALLAKFMDQNTTGVVFLPTITLRSVLDACGRTGSAVETSFIEKTMRTMAKYVALTEDLAEITLTPNVVKMTANRVIFLDPFANMDSFPSNEMATHETQRYHAPEVRSKWFPISHEKSLVWSIGAITHEMMGKHPLLSDSTPVLDRNKLAPCRSLKLKRHLKGPVIKKTSIREKTDDLERGPGFESRRDFLSSLTERCLDMDPVARPTARQLLRRLSQ